MNVYQKLKELGRHNFSVSQIPKKEREEKPETCLFGNNECWAEAKWKIDGMPYCQDHAKKVADMFI